MRTAIRGLGEVFISLGVVILLFVVYQLYWTGVLADRAAAEELDKLKAQIKTAAPPAPAAPDQPAPKPPPYVAGETVAAMYIPRFGSGWKKPILAGADASMKNELKKGLGWYPGGAQAGQDGNFAVAGHRRTYGDPFLDFPDLRPGDKVIIQDAQNYYIYTLDKPQVMGDKNKAVYLTVPEDVHVVDPVPEKAYGATPGKYLTLTTCDPEWGSSHRLIVWGHLEQVLPNSSGTPDALK